MTDIRLPLGELEFSVRVALLCVRRGRLLVNSGVDADGLAFWFPPGGALTAGEDTTACAEREWREETGTPPGPLRLAGIVESLFGLRGTRHHQISFFYRMDAPPELPETPFPVLDDDRFTCEWLAPDQLGSRPTLARTVLTLLEGGGETVRHLVNREWP